MLIDGKVALSDSLQAALDGENLENSQSEIIPSVLEPIDVDSLLSDISSQSVEKENNKDGNKPRLPLVDGIKPTKKGSSTSSLELSKDESVPKRKRRSLTEIHKLNPISQGTSLTRKSIIFETDV